MPVDREAFAGRTAIVTGGGSGIGRALGTELAALGATVVLADLDAAAATRAAEEITSAVAPLRPSVAVEPAALDVRDAGAVADLVGEVAGRHGSLDLMFNNAGVAMAGETHAMDRAYWRRMIEVNLDGVVNGVAAAYPLLVAQGGGHIVNTASAMGLVPAVLTVAYTATKHAVVGLSTSLRPEAALHGVRVSVLCPGAVDTPILDRALPADLPARTDAYADVTGRAFLRRLGLPPMPVDRFASRALREVARDRAVIVVPRSAKAAWYAHRLSPVLTERVNRLVARRVLTGGVAAPPTQART